MIKMHDNQGFTLVELMVSLVVASILMVGIASVFAMQSAVVVTQDQRVKTAEDGRDAFNLLVNTVRMANISSITVNTTAGTTTIDFTLPSGFRIWPNTTAPYTNNAVRISWTNTGNNAYQLMVGTADSITNLGTATLVAMAGSNSGQGMRVTGLSMTDPEGDGSWLLTLTTQTGAQGGNTPATVVFESLIMPRN